MRRKSAKLLEDIRDAAEFIVGLTRDKTLEDWRVIRENLPVLVREVSGLLNEVVDPP